MHLYLPSFAFIGALWFPGPWGYLQGLNETKTVTDRELEGTRHVLCLAVYSHPTSRHCWFWSQTKLLCAAGCVPKTGAALVAPLSVLDRGPTL